MPTQTRIPSKTKKNNPSTLNTKRTGDILRAAREAKGRSLEDVSKAIKVRVPMLQSIEQGKFFGLTDPLYLKGFIKAYALYVGLDEHEVLPFFRREYDEQREQQQLSQPLSPIEPKKSKITPGWVVVGFLTLAILVVIGYSYNQYVSVALNPDLSLSQPQSNSTSTNGQLQVEGQTNPDSTLTLNGQSVQLDPDGKFKFTVGLATGSNTLRFEAVNKLGKSTVVERTVVGPVKLASQATIQASSSAGRPTPTQSTASATLSNVNIEVVIGASPAWIEVSGDDKQLFSGLLLPSSSQSFSANTKIRLKSGNAGSTRVLLHGIDQGLLGQPNQVIEKEYVK